MNKYGVMDQDKYTGEIEPKVSLVSSTSYPLGTIFMVWHGSRHNDTYSAKDIEDILLTDESKWSDKLKHISETLAKTYEKSTGKDAIESVIKDCIDMNLPITESVHLTFCIDDATIALREQLVRHRQAGIWVQTSRTRDARTIDIAMNPNIKLFGGDEAETIYCDISQKIRDAYDDLISLGVPQEDIRLQPSSSTHRIYLFVTLRTLMQIMGKRTSWIAQATLWTPILSQLFDILRELNLYNSMGSITSNNGAKLSRDSEGNLHISDYDFKLDAEARLQGEDPLPVDPLYLAYKNCQMPEHTDIRMYDAMKKQFIKIWSDEYLEVLGWDRDKPSVLGKYDRPKKDK